MEVKIDNGGTTNFHSFYSISELGLVILLVDQTQLDYGQKRSVGEIKERLSTTFVDNPIVGEKDEPIWIEDRSIGQIYLVSTSMKNI
jgi:hypothetical protein